MKLFKSPVFATILTIVVVFASILINTNVKFGRKCEAVTDQFFDGSASIASRLETVSSDAASLVAVAERYDVDASQVKSYASALRGSLQSENVYMTRLAYSELSSSLTALTGQLANTELSAADKEDVERCTSSIADAQSAINASSYNETVRSFQRRYDHFPTNVLADMAGVDMPQTF